MGAIRTTDWLPVGGEENPNEHRRPGPLSESSSSADAAQPSSTDETEPGTSDFEESSDLFEPSE